MPHTNKHTRLLNQILSVSLCFPHFVGELKEMYDAFSITRINSFFCSFQSPRQQMDEGMYQIGKNIWIVDW